MKLKIDSIRTDGGTQTRAVIDQNTVAQYSDDMRAGAAFPPIVVFHDGAEYWLADGFHRVMAATAAGVREIDSDVKQGTRRDAVLFSVGANARHGLRRTNEDKRRAIETLLNDAEWSKWSNRKIAEVCAVDHVTVGRMRTSEQVTSGEIHQIEQVKYERNGKTFEMVPARVNYQEVRAAIEPQRFESEPQFVSPVLAVEAPRPHVAHNSGNNEWYTPVEYIDAARLTMGGIDLDPASSDIANRTVQAKRFYTADDDGLVRDWIGRVWMNPPYASELIGRFSYKLADHVKSGDVTQAIVLVNNATETAWFSALISVASAVMFTKGRVKFLDPDGNPGAPLQGQAVIYCGNRPAAFRDAFKEFGWTALL